MTSFIQCTRSKMIVRGLGPFHLGSVTFHHLISSRRAYLFASVRQEVYSGFTSEGICDYCAYHAVINIATGRDSSCFIMLRVKAAHSFALEDGHCCSHSDNVHNE